MASTRTNNHANIDHVESHLLLIPYRNERKREVDTLKHHQIGDTSAKTYRFTVKDRLLRLIFSMITSLGAVYFLVFGLLVYQNDGQPADRSMNVFLVEAARAGPTVFAIVFAGIVGSFLKALAGALLERGATIGLIEYLLSSRTVFSAATLPIRLRFAHVAAPILIMLWALSPLGGQASLRVVSTNASSYSDSALFDYLDVLNSSWKMSGASLEAYLGSGVDAAFTAAIIAPIAVKDSSMDVFRNVKIPMIEKLATRGERNNSEWHEVDEHQANTDYSALLGVPIKRPNSVVRFPLRTSYMSVSCSAVHEKATNHTMNPCMAKYSNAWCLGMDSDTTHSANSLDPLRIHLYSRGYTENFENEIVTSATCDITQTYVETKVACTPGDCRVRAMRETKPSPFPSNACALDGIFGDAAAWGDPSLVLQTTFFGPFINSTLSERYSSSGTSPLLAYLTGSVSPFATASDANVDIMLYETSDELISTRLAQLLNTHWLAGVAPYAVSGNFSAPSSVDYGVRSVPGEIIQTDVVIRCNTLWLTILLITAVIMLCAGLASTVLEGVRRGPDVLDAFVTTLRDNPYASTAENSGASFENQQDVTKRLRNEKVKLGDVRPLGEIGHVAIAIPTVVRPVTRPAVGRKYD